MAFYAPNIENLETAPNFDSNNLISYGVVWEHIQYETNIVIACVILEEPISGHKITQSITKNLSSLSLNTPNNMIQGEMSITGQDYLYFNDKDIVVKVGIKDYDTSGDLTDYTETLEGQSFHFYTPPTLSLNFNNRGVLNKNYVFEFDYNSNYGLDYINIEIYDLTVGVTNSFTNLVESKKINGSGETNITLSTQFSNLEDGKSYGMVGYIKTIDGGEGWVYRYTNGRILYVGNTTYYNNLSINDLIVESMCHYRNGDSYYYSSPCYNFTINNEEKIDLTVGCLKTEDSSYNFYNYKFSNGKQNNNEENARILFPYSGSISTEIYLLDYYNIDNKEYKVSILGNTANRPPADTSNLLQLLSNVQNKYYYHYITLTPNIEANINVSTLKLDNNNGYNFNVSFSQTANSIVDYAEFFITDNERNVLLSSKKVYNNRNDSTSLTLNYYFDLSQFDENKILKLYIKVKNIYGDTMAINSDYYKFTVKKWFNININNVSYKDNGDTYSYIFDIDCESNNVYVKFLLIKSDTDARISWVSRFITDFNEKITVTLLKSIHPQFTIADIPYYFQVGAKSTDTFDSDDIATILDKSEKTVVYYVENPTLSLNISDNDTIGTSGYNFILNYIAQDGEPIDYGIFYLYDSDENLLMESEKLFNIEDPPLILCKYFGGFLNNTQYKIKAYVKTFHGLEVETDLIDFNVEYESPMLYAPIKLRNVCNEGYVEVRSDIFIGEGESNPSPMIYIDETDKYSAYAIKSDPIIEYQRETSSWVYWDDGVDVNKDFVIKYWFSTGSTNHNILRLYNDDGTYINVKFKRLNRSNEFNGDYVEVSTSENVIANSNILNSRTNGTNHYFLWLKVVDNQWEVILSEYADTKQTSVFEWNSDNNNINWNVTSDLKLYGEGYEDDNLQSPLYTFNPEGFDKIIIGNGICRYLEVTNNINLTYSDDIDNWDEYMVMKCDFDQNLKGGNLQEQLGSISAIRIKRKDHTHNTWITLYEKEIETEEDLSILFKDYIIPKGIEQTYALVPIMANGDEGNYITNEIIPNHSGVFIYDGRECFKLYSAVSYGTGVSNTPIGVLNPIGRQYPITSQNSSIDYFSGILSGQLMGYNYETTHRLDRVDVVKQTQDFCKFLKNGRAKVITDWNGNCWIVRIIDSPSMNYNINTTNGINTITVSWVEQGKYNNESDLVENDLI